MKKGRPRKKADRLVDKGGIQEMEKVKRVKLWSKRTQEFENLKTAFQVIMNLYTYKLWYICN